MNRKVTTKRDPYGFSLGLFSMVGSYMMPVALSDTLINTAIDARMRRASGRGGAGEAERLSQDTSLGQIVAPNWDSAHCFAHDVDLPCDCQAA